MSTETFTQLTVNQKLIERYPPVLSDWEICSWWDRGLTGQTCTRVQHGLPNPLGVCEQDWGPNSPFDREVKNDRRVGKRSEFVRRSTFYYPQKSRGVWSDRVLQCVILKKAPNLEQRDEVELKLNLNKGK